MLLAAGALTPSVTAKSVSQSDDLLAIGRFGVGYDAVYVKACTDADVAVFITAGAVDRPVAEATVGWMIGLTHHIRAKDHLVRWIDQQAPKLGKKFGKLQPPAPPQQPPPDPSQQPPQTPG